MRCLTIAVIMLRVALNGLPAHSAQDFQIFDTHLHYSQNSWDNYSPEAILTILDKAGVARALVSSTPDDGTLKLYAKAPQRIVPILRPYRTRGDMGGWHQDPAVLAYVEERLQKGIYRGIGEFHLSGGETNTPVIKRLVELALRTDVAPGGQLDPAWRALFLRHRERFMLGTDT